MSCNASSKSDRLSTSFVVRLYTFLVSWKRKTSTAVNSPSLWGVRNILPLNWDVRQLVILTHSCHRYDCLIQEFQSNLESVWKLDKCRGIETNKHGLASNVWFIGFLDNCLFWLILLYFLFEQWPRLVAICYEWTPPRSTIYLSFLSYKCQKEFLFCLYFRDFRKKWKNILMFGHCVWNSKNAKSKLNKKEETKSWSMYISISYLSIYCRMTPKAFWPGI